ncbi:MAG: hypothetical protein CM15mP93_03010 [Thiotrichaceae bacterium]|nr:MAG: hypothetical protein CM15mP93_03010 [Thiotrichaceae bacterium]
MFFNKVLIISSSVGLFATITFLVENLIFSAILLFPATITLSIQKL